MLQAFVDGSSEGDSSTLVLAGYLASAEAWAAFSDEWQAQLDEAGLRYFKMSEMAGRPEIAAWFYRLIEKHALVAMSSVVNTADLVAAVRAINWPPLILRVDRTRLENPYFAALAQLVAGLVSMQRSGSLPFAEPVDIICDTQSEMGSAFPAWQWVKASFADRPIGPLLGDIYYKDDVKVRPLQAADLYAWWVRKWMADGLADNAIEALPFPWIVKRDIRRFHVSSDAQTIFNVLERGVFNDFGWLNAWASGWRASQVRFVQERARNRRRSHQPHTRERPL